LISSLDFLAQGQEWPPKDRETRERFNMYDTNKELFHGEHAKQGGIFDEDLKRLRRVVGNYDEVVDFVTLLNYHKLISVKTADLIFGEKPLITSEGNKETIEQIEENTQMFNKFYENVIDCSRYGNGLFYIYEDDENKYGDFDLTQPRFWIPVVDPNNYKKIMNHVIVYMSCDSDDNKYLHAQIHYKGYFERKVFKMSEDKPDTIMTALRTDTMIRKDITTHVIGNLTEEERVETGLSDFAIQVTSNTVTSDSMFGLNDYDDINSLVCSLMVRVGQIEKILDKHSSPSVNAPSSAAQQDPETGEWSLKMGNVFFRDSNDDPPTEYITWDAQLEANFKQIELLLNQLYVISEMGATLLGGEDKGGSNTSGRALKFKMISPLAKAKRITMLLDPVIKNVIKLVSSLGGENIKDLTDEKITIKWQDGLPNDKLEEAEIIEKRKNSGTMSTKTVLMEYDQMSEDKAEEELEYIAEENAQNNPLAINPFAGNNVVEEGEDDE